MRIGVRSGGRGRETTALEWRTPGREREGDGGRGALAERNVMRLQMKSLQQETERKLLNISVY